MKTVYEIIKFIEKKENLCFENRRDNYMEQGALRLNGYIEACEDILDFISDNSEKDDESNLCSTEEKMEFIRDRLALVNYVMELSDETLEILEEQEKENEQL